VVAHDIDERHTLAYDADEANPLEGRRTRGDLTAGGTL
jgi:hypothetical protein